MSLAVPFRLGLFALALLLAAPAAEAQQQKPPLSPRDTARMETSAGKVFVDYGRPSMRGRKIMGGLVPWGQVWRTGANKATHLVTSADLQLGGVHLPKGTYTLYTLPSPGGWQLIVNRQTGQWGTQYDPAQDVARIPMRVSRTKSPVEKFTIALDPGKNGKGELALLWESTRASVPLVVGHSAHGGHHSH